jgi:uncharacterized protein
LIDMKGNIMRRQKVGFSVLMLAVLILTGCGRAAQRDVVQNAQDGTPCLKRADVKLISAALKRNTPTMEEAIKSGADVNAIVEGLGPPIVITAMVDNYDGVKLLLDRGASINAEDSEGHTPLINASFSDSPNMVRLLLSKCANANAPSNLMVNGKPVRFTPMMIAKSKGSQEIVRLLTEAGAKE